MQSLEAGILFDMSLAYGFTADQRMQMGRSDSLDSVAADYSFLVAHRDLYRGLHTLTDGKKRFCVPGAANFRIEADDEGGLAFRLWETRPFNPEAELCRPN